MDHIKLAIGVLRWEIAKLNNDLKHARNLPHHEEEIMEKLQKLNRAVNDISTKFNA